MKSDMVEPALFLSGSTFGLCEIGEGEQNWVEGEDRKSGVGLRDEFQTYIRVLNAATRPSKSRYTETTRLQRLDVVRAHWKCPSTATRSVRSLKLLIYTAIS